jgi:hypothetical protein
MHKTRSFLTLRPQRLGARSSHAKPQRPQRRSALAVLIFLAAFCLPLTAYSQSTGGAKGKVRNSRNQPVAGVSVTARMDGKDVRTVTSGTKGDFTLTGLEPGIYNFVFDAPGYSSAIRYNIAVRRNKSVDLGDRLILVVDKGTLVIIQGSVFFKDGTSVTGARVEVEKINADGTTSSLPPLNTNIYGEFTLHQPQQGHAKFRFTAKYKDRTASNEIEVDSAAVYYLAIKLDLARTNN